jgi:hypothetical protein
MKTKFFFLPIISVFLFALFSCNNAANGGGEFSAIRNGLDNSNANLAIANEQIYAQFEKARMNSANAKVLYDAAMVVKKISMEFAHYLDELKSGGEISDQKLSELETKTKELRETIVKIGGNDFKIDSSGCSEYIANIKGFQTQKNLNGTEAMLAMIQAEAVGMEFKILNNLFAQVSASSFKFDNLAAIVVPEKTVLSVGENFNANVFVAATNTTSSPTIWICDVDPATNNPIGKIDSTSVMVSNGIGHVSMNMQSAGQQKLSGVIKVKGSDDSWLSYPFNFSYEVK